jgi:hypothetical protein
MLGLEMLKQFKYNTGLNEIQTKIANTPELSFAMRQFRRQAG